MRGEVRKAKMNFDYGPNSAYRPTMEGIAEIPLEDELGDVLEKAMRQAELSYDQLSAKTGISISRIRDAVDYRPDLTSDELNRIAGVLHLNEVGFCALGAGLYPLPGATGLPFSVWPLRMKHGIGVVNAYLVSAVGDHHGILIDTGAGIEALEPVWPKQITTIDAVFVTHVEAEHAGALCDVVGRYAVKTAYAPAAVQTPCGKNITEGQVVTVGKFQVTAYSTPGHCSEHACYKVELAGARPGRAMLATGDLIFAGSAGGAYFCHQQLQTQTRRVLSLVPEDTLLAPGHGPLTTVGNELRFNPFLG